MEHLNKEDVTSLSRIVSDRIKEYIVTHKLEPGDRLPTERNLAETLAVSRPVIREALSHLETLGLIDKKQGKGLFIKEQNMSRLFQEMMFITRGDQVKFTQLLEFRTVLEQAAVLQAMENITSSELEALTAIIDQAEKEDAYTAFTQLDLQFHRMIVSLSSNYYLLHLTEVIDNYFTLLDTSEKNETVSEEVKKKTLEGHRQLVKLLQNRDRLAALDLLNEHLLHKTNK
ncbi:FadR/GntR family transcriptional regulator [Paenibacillus chungangensis]|uniref:FadR/GntR family transcriptional regulator n=1 Tax=Paenibacillus chungangensis TaxID=696535 RepID=A0ABW3HUA4_9BACL